MRRSALLAASMAAWLHQLTAITAGEDILAGHGVRGGKAMIATLRWRLIAVPGRLIRHAAPDPAATARTRAASRGPGPAAGPAPFPPDLRLLSSGSPSLSTAPSPGPQKGRKPRTRRVSRGDSMPRPGILAHPDQLHRRQSAHSAIRRSGRQSPRSLPDHNTAGKGRFALEPLPDAETHRTSLSHAGPHLRCRKPRTTSSFTVSLDRRGGSALVDQFETA